MRIDYQNKSRSFARPILGIIMFLSAGVNEASDPPAMLGNAKRVSGKWAGTYECFQGEVAATLTLAGHKNGTVEGDFLFYPTSANPKTATGRFIVTGSYYIDRSLVLGSGAWVEQPDGYIPVSLKGKVNAAFDTFTGTVPECFNANFILKRVPGVHYDQSLN